MDDVDITHLHGSPQFKRGAKDAKRNFAPREATPQYLEGYAREYKARAERPDAASPKEPSRHVPLPGQQGLAGNRTAAHGDPPSDECSDTMQLEAQCMLPPGHTGDHDYETPREVAPPPSDAAPVAWRWRSTFKVDGQIISDWVPHKSNLSISTPH